MKKLFTVLCLTGSVCNMSIANACTTLIIKDNQGGVYQGRTMEFGGGLPQMYLKGLDNQSGLFLTNFNIIA